MRTLRDDGAKKRWHVIAPIARQRSAIVESAKAACWPLMMKVGGLFDFIG